MLCLLVSSSCLCVLFLHHVAALSLPDTQNLKRATGAECCTALQAKLGDQVLYPTNPQYISEQTGPGPSGYWSNQEREVLPTCRVAATSSQDVSTAIQALVANSCQFAIRSGGHMSWAGSANIEDGVTIDLSALNAVTVQPNNIAVSVGPGARWADVYSKLDGLNLTVAGGRVASVGVGGLLTGGGNSFYAPRYGFGADNVLNFEVVLANGSIAQANLTTNSDLYKALKGGNNNFGIVTRFDMRAISQNLIWGGIVFYPVDTLHTQLGYLQQFATDSGNGVDDYAAIIWTYILTAAGPTAIANIYTHTEPRDDAPIFANFRTLTPLAPGTTSYRTLTSLAQEIDTESPSGSRWAFAVLTLGNNATLFEQVLLLANTVYVPVQTTVSGFQVSIDLQPITRAITGKSAATGGNSLGLDPSDGDVHWFHLTVKWSLAADDTIMISTTESYLRQVATIAKDAGAFNEYVYLNYALPSQDPIPGYGAANVANLKAVSQKYDPDQVFQNLVPGGFKLTKTATCC